MKLKPHWSLDTPSAMGGLRAAEAMMQTGRQLLRPSKSRLLTALGLPNCQSQ